VAFAPPSADIVPRRPTIRRLTNRVDCRSSTGRSLEGDRITATGQVFRMAMYHENHPDKDYKMANRVEVFDEPRAIAWQPGTESPETGELSFGGWIWRYDLEATGPSRTTVTLTYDWSAVRPTCASTSSSRRSGRTTSTTHCSTSPTSSPRCGCPDRRVAPARRSGMLPRSRIRRVLRMHLGRRRRSAA
jgi:hypothetical protein